MRASAGRLAAHGGLLLVVACGGGRSTLGDTPDAARPAADGQPAASRSAAGPPAENVPRREGAEVFVPNDVGAPTRERADPPASCADVGRFVGVTSCCAESFCNGSCADDACRCSDIDGGCPSPLVCCRDACVGPLSPRCRSVSSYDSSAQDQRPVVYQQNCGIHYPPSETQERGCCRGDLCEGSCRVYDATGEATCDCAYLEGGCLPGLRCARGIGCVVRVPPPVRDPPERR